MVRILWLAGLLAAVTRAQEQYASVIFDNEPRMIDEDAPMVTVIPTILHPDSPLLNTTDVTSLQKRAAVDVVIASVAAGAGVIVAGNSAIQLYDNIAAKIKTNQTRTLVLLSTEPTTTTAITKATLIRLRPLATSAIQRLSRSLSTMLCAPVQPSFTRLGL